MEDSLYLDIYLDGSAYRNPGHEGGIGAIIQFSDERKPVTLQEKYSKTTNNRMELLAVVKATEYARALNKRERIGGLTIWSDSRYVCDNYSRVAYWARDGWVNQDGKIKDNIDLWKKLLSLRRWSGLTINIEWVKGKTTDILKEVDKLAKKAAKSIIANRDLGYNPGKVSRSKVLGGAAPALFPATGQRVIIRIYGYEIKAAKSKKEYKIKFDLYSADEKRFISKYFAYFPFQERSFHRNHCYEATFNNNSNYAVIESLSEIECLSPKLDTAINP